MGQIALTVGFRLRNKIKARLDFHNISWREYRGLLQSSFSGQGDDDDVRDFYQWLKDEFP